MRSTTSTAMAVAVAIWAAAPALAQDAVCGGIGAQGTWVGGTSETSDIATAGAPLGRSGIMVAPGGQDITLFSVSRATAIRIEALPQPGGDTVIDLFDEGGALILTDDDSGGMLASRGEAMLEPGIYCMATRGFSGGPLVADLRVGRAEHEPLTPGAGGSNLQACLPSTPATRLGSGPVEAALDQGLSATGSIASSPYYRFTLNTAAPISIRAENQMADPYIFLYDSAGTLIAENDDYTDLNARLDFTEGLAPGTYCLGLIALSDPTAPVTVSVRGYDAASEMHDLYATAEASPPPDGSVYPVTDLGALQTRLVRDVQVGADAAWFNFSVPQGGLALVDAIGVGNSDPVIFLYDGVGRMIGLNDDSGGTLDSQLAARVGPGSYMLGVTQYHGSTGIIRVAIERFVPAQ